MIQSGILFSTGPKSDAWSQVLEIIIALAKTKAWLREECGWVLYKSIQCFKGHSNETVYARTLIDKFVSSGLARELEGVAIWLGVQSTFPNIDLPPYVWHRQNPLNREDLSKLSGLLNNTSTEKRKTEATHKSPQNSTWSSNLHFAWEVILDAILKQNMLAQNKNLESDIFAEFWTVAVDSKLLFTLDVRILNVLR